VQLAAVKRIITHYPDIPESFLQLTPRILLKEKRSSTNRMDPAE